MTQPTPITTAATEPGREALTYRQSALVEQLARGLSMRQAANVLGIAYNTAQVHLYGPDGVYKRIGITHKGELILWAIRHGFGNRPGGMR